MRAVWSMEEDRSCDPSRANAREVTPCVCALSNRRRHCPVDTFHTLIFPSCKRHKWERAAGQARDRTSITRSDTNQTRRGTDTGSRTHNIFSRHRHEPWQKHALPFPSIAFPGKDIGQDYPSITYHTSHRKSHTVPVHLKRPHKPSPCRTCSIPSAIQPKLLTTVQWS